jgi:arginine repressor
MKWPEIVGTLAGDNTILVVVQSRTWWDGAQRFKTLIRY